MRLMKRTTRQHTDVLKILVPSLLEIIFTLSRFIGPKILMCVFQLSLARMPRAFGVAVPRVIIIRGQRSGISASTGPARRCMTREQFGYEQEKPAKGWKAKEVFTR